MLKERKKIAVIAAEFLGAAILTMVALAVTRAIGNAYFTGLALGLAMAALVFAFSKISGAQFNPAITLGLLTARKIELPNSVVYIAAQLLGGISSYALYGYLTNQHWSNSGHFDSRVLVAEAVGAFIFSLGWAACVYNKYDEGKTAFVIGGSLAVGIIVASIVSAGILNPAVALGMRAWGWGTYVLGPVLGSVIGFNLYALLFAPAKSLTEKEK